MNADNQVMPRCRRSAYSLFLQDYLKQYKFQLKIEKLQFNYPQFAKQCSLQWRDLPEEGKQHYRKLSKQDELRYEGELKLYKEKTLDLSPKEEDSVDVFDASEKLTEAVVEPEKNDLVDEKKDKQETTMQQEPEAMEEHIDNQIEHNFPESDIDDMAFDLFCSEEMPKVREQFAPLSRRMSGEQMLDELWRRWEEVGDELMQDYRRRAIEEALSYER